MRSVSACGSSYQTDRPTSNFLLGPESGQFRQDRPHGAHQQQLFTAGRD